MSSNPEIDAIIDGVQEQSAPVDTKTPAPSVDELNGKVGKLVNELAESRRSHDILKAELEALRTQQLPVQVQSDNPNDKQWNEWAKGVVKEVGAESFLTDPANAAEKMLIRAGKDFARQAETIANNTAYRVGSALQMDSEFNRIYPDLGTDMGVVAQQQAIAELAPNAKFQQLMRLPATRPRALAAVAKLARQKLGMTEESNRVLDENDDIPQRKSVFASPAGARPSGLSPREVDAKDTDGKAMGDMIAYQRSRS